MARRRILKPDEAALWQAVARTATPMHNTAPKLLESPIQNMPPKLRPIPQTGGLKIVPMVLPFRLGQNVKVTSGVTLNNSLQDSLRQAPVQMDKKSYARMSKGKLAPEAKLDLHGMTVAQAHPALQRFVLRCHDAGMRLVLVVTGKGKQSLDIGPTPQKYGILRHQVPQWLRIVPLAPVVLQTAQAHVRHGGEGAYYIYLRRR